MELGFEPLQNGLGVEKLFLKALFIHGVIGKDFANLHDVYRVAKREACYLFHCHPEPENITVLKCVVCQEYGGFMVLVTDGSTRK